MSVAVRPITLREARRFVGEHHRHNEPDKGWKFGVGITCCAELVGVGVAGRPKAAALDDGMTVEITRCCTVGTPNAASMIYGSLCRAAAALGHWSAVTYTLQTEKGTSLKAAGFHIEAEVPAASEWIRSEGTFRNQRDLFGNERRPPGAKYRWRRWFVVPPHVSSVIRWMAS